MTKLLLKCAFLSFLTLLAAGIAWGGKKPANPAKLPVDADVEVRKQMVEWSRQLGVTCIHCHNLENFKSYEKKQMDVAKAHSKWVLLLNVEGHYKNAPKVDCFMCHRGQPIPDYKEVKETEKH